MGFAIKRPDGTYRAWNRNAPDEHLRPGEAWEERDAEPAITTPPLSDTDRGAQFDAATLVKAVTMALLDEIDARHPGQRVDRVAFRQAVIARLKG